MYIILIYIYLIFFSTVLGRCCFAHFTGVGKKTPIHRKNKQFVQDHTASNVKW